MLFFYVTCLRFEFVKSLAMTLCGWWGYKPSLNKHTNIHSFSIQMDINIDIDIDIDDDKGHDPKRSHCCCM